MSRVAQDSYAPNAESDLLNPPGRPCRCDGIGCRDAAAWCEPGQIAAAINRDRFRRRVQPLRDAFASTTSTDTGALAG